MLLSAKPPEVLTNESMIMFLYCKILNEQANAGVAPIQITEGYGYYPSETLSAIPVRTVDGGDRQIIRILMPVDRRYFGSSNPIWEHTGIIV